MRGYLPLLALIIFASSLVEAKTAIYYDVIKACRSPTNDQFVVERSAGGKKPVGIKYALVAPVKEDGALVNYEYKRDMSVFDSDWPTNASYYAFYQFLNTVDVEEIAGTYSRSCVSAGSAPLRYLYPARAIGTDNCIKLRTPETTEETLSSEDIESLAIDGGWDTNGRLYDELEGDFRIWQESYCDYECVLKFNANGGNGSEYSMVFTNACEESAEHGKTGFILPPLKGRFTRTGHTFIGWDLDKSSQDEACDFKDGAKVEADRLTSDTTLYARWEKNRYTLVVAADEGGEIQVSGAAASERYINDFTYNDSVAIAAYPHTGYTFERWSDGSTEKSRMITIASNVTYTASFSQQFVVKFNKNSVSAENSMSNQCFVTGEQKALSLNKYEHSISNFVGWATSAVGSVEFTDGQVVDSDELKAYDADSDYAVELYAVWAPVKVTVTFVAGNGVTVSPSAKTVICGEDYGELPTPVRDKQVGSTKTTYYSFVDWYTAATGGNPIKSSTVVAGKENRDLYPHWLEQVSNNSYTVSLQVKEAEVEWASTNVELQYQAQIPPLPSPKRAGYQFAVWTNEVYGKALKVGEKSFVTNAATFYATWTPGKYTITLDRQGGSKGDAQVIAVYDQQVSSLNSMPEKAGFMFLGYTNKVGETLFDMKGDYQGGIWREVSDLTLYARWKKISVAGTIELSLDCNGQGSLTNALLLVASDEMVGELPIPEHESEWRFFGWFTQKEGGERVTDKSIFDQNATVYARWGLSKLNEILGTDEVAFQLEGEPYGQETHGWQETENQYEGHRTLRVFGGKDGNRDGLRSGESAILVVLPTGNGRVGFVYGNLSTEPQVNKFTIRVDNNVEEDLTRGDSWEWKPAEYEVTNSVRIKLHEEDEEGYTWVNAQASVSAFTWESLVPKGEIASWDSAVTNGQGAAFAIYGSEGWQLSTNANDRVEGTNGMVAAGLADGRFTEIAFKTNCSGTVRFKWRTSCERGYRDEKGVYQYTDYLEVRTNGVRVAVLDGQQEDFREYELSVAADCEVSWRYVKDADGAEGLDKAWLDAFSFVDARVGTYVVRFEANGADGEMADWFCRPDVVYKLPDCKFRSGKPFIGWDCNGKYYDDGMLFFNLEQVGREITMRAMWGRD